MTDDDDDDDDDEEKREIDTKYKYHTVTL